MRCVFLSNYYPPHALGGYEMWCRDVAEELVRRGHEVSVLTSRSANLPALAFDAGVAVHRRLVLEVEGGLVSTIVRMLVGRQRAERQSLASLRNLLREFSPDVALTWGMWNISRIVPASLEQLLPGRVAYYLCDYWPTLPNAYVQRWREPARRSSMSFLKKRLATVALPRLEAQRHPDLRMELPLCVSRALRDGLRERGSGVANARVLLGGIQVERFEKSRTEDLSSGSSLRLVYLGRLAAEKGVHTAIEAVRLAGTTGGLPVTLDIIGSGDRGYAATLTEAVARNGLQKVVTFHGAIDHQNVPAILRTFHALLFPSEWDEPFPRVVLEAMASGLAVIGTSRGGTSEVLADEVTGLVFPAGDAPSLADRIRRLGDDAELRQRLVTEAYRRVRRDFNFERMVNDIESALAGLAGERPAAVSS